MRLHSRELATRGRSGVLKLGVVGVLLGILMLVAAGCGDDSQPTATEDPLNTQIPTDTPPAPVDPVESQDSDVLPLESGVPSEGVGITFGRALLRPDGRITLFYVASTNSGTFEAATIINDADIVSSDGRSWPADEYGELRHRAPLTLGWLTFSVSDAAPGDLQVAVNSMQAGSGPVKGPFQVQQLRGLKARSDISKAVIIDSGLCVSSDGVAFGFHEKACATEFVDPHTVRQKGTSTGATPVTPQPTPTPVEYSARPTTPPSPHSTESLDVVDSLLFTVCTPWLIRLPVIIEHTGTPSVGGMFPSHSVRCVFPYFPQQREDGDALDAQLVGELVLENGCLRGKSIDGTDHLLIWPQRFKLTVAGGDIRISDDSGVSFNVGEEIRVGGGEMPLAHLQTLVKQPVPNDCPGPYWVIGEVPISSSASHRLDLDDGIVVAFIEGLSGEFEGKIAYVTHVATGSQLVLDRYGQVVDRHDGREDGPDRLDGVLVDDVAMEHITERLQSDEDARPYESAADWVHSVQFDGITYLAKASLDGSINTEGERALAIEDLGPELYRVAFRIDGYGGYAHRDGDATYLNPGTPVYSVKGYAPEFRLAALEDGNVRLFEADTNSAAKTGEGLLDIRGKVTAINVLSEEDGRTVLAIIDDEGVVENFVELVLESLVDQEHRDREGPRYFLGFRLADGTSVVRAFWLESGELWRGIMTDPTVASMVSSALPVEPAVREALRNMAKDPMARIAERVPGFGGAFRDSDRKVVYIYLQDASLREEAERALTEEFGSDFLAGREVRVLEGDYSMDHLDAWYRTISGVISQVPGIVYTDLDEGKNRIEIVMYPRRGGREEMEAAIATVNVPRGAVVIDVGCEGIRQWPLDLGEPPGEAFPSEIDYSLEVVSQAAYGETVEMKLTLQNVSNEAVSFSLGGSPAYDFVVSTADGEYVWHSMCAKFALALLGSETLGPGEELEFVGEWEQVDNRGEPVPPGTYSMRAVLNLESPEKLVTEVQKVEVVQ